MKQKTKLLRLVKREPGHTATWYTRTMFPPKVSEYWEVKYKPATILKELHRFVLQGKLTRVSGPGMRGLKAWLFYPVK